MEKGFNKLGEFNYIYKSFNVFCASNPFVACRVTNKISIFLMIMIEFVVICGVLT